MCRTDADAINEMVAAENNEMLKVKF